MCASLVARWCQSGSKLAATPCVLEAGGGLPDRAEADNETSGGYLVDKAIGEVYSIKAYGVPNRRLGTLAELTAR